MRSLLLALDDTPAGAGAASLAMSISTRHNAAVTGASILDIDYLTAPEPHGIGTTYYKLKADAAQLKRGHNLTERLFEGFLRQWEARSVKDHVLALEGRPWEELRAAAAVYDLILVGRDSHLGSFTTRMLTDCPMPHFIHH